MLFAAILGLCLCAALSNAVTKPTAETLAHSLEKRALKNDQQSVDLESRFFSSKHAKHSCVRVRRFHPKKKKHETDCNDTANEDDTVKKNDTPKKEDAAKKDAPKGDAPKGDAGKAGNAGKPKTLLPDEADDSGIENLNLNLNKRSLESLTSRVPDYDDDDATEAESLNDIDDLI